MNAMPTPIAETDVVGRHGSVLERDITYPTFDMTYVQQGAAIVAIRQEVALDQEPDTELRPLAVRPIDPYTEIWR